MNPTDEITKSFGLPSQAVGTDDELIADVIQRVVKLRSAVTETTSDATMESVEEPSDSADQLKAGLGLLHPPREAGELGRLANYRILKILGSGGMGVVFLAEDEHLRRRVALKVLKPAEARKPSSKNRFLREARAAAAIEHDNVVTIHQVGEDRGIPFIAMPMLQGDSLKTLLEREKRLSQERAIFITRQAAEGLDAAHQTGLIHRDIKPDNLWIDSGKDRVKILDFGLVRELDNDDGLTVHGTVLGTPSYMSPEQAAGERLITVVTSLALVPCFIKCSVDARLMRVATLQQRS